MRGGRLSLRTVRIKKSMWEPGKSKTQTKHRECVQSWCWCLCSHGEGLGFCFVLGYYFCFVLTVAFHLLTQ